MPSVEQLRTRLIKKLTELFQLDQPDLDFGFYRIMHAKAQEVQEFISTDLLKIVADAFGDADEVRKAELQAKIEQEVQAAREYGVANPENSPKVKEAQAAYEAAKDTASAEADVYDHLYRFFERYYDDGDFISRRYYTRETSGKAAPFAVPYNGEEVKLHWANADQYYIKSAEYFSNFTFDLTRSAEVRKMSKEERELKQIPDSPLKVHFRVVEATEGEHGNVKASEQNKRFFIIRKEKPVEFNEAGELICNFEYRPDPEKSGQENTWRDKRNAEAVATVLQQLEAMPAAAEYLRLFEIPAPTDKDKKRPVLAKYINQYTARNTMDYFIHKDLGGFLRRELDFYIKNEVMRLDDIENAEAPAVESYLAKLKVLRKIAGKLIEFLAQLEDFQKKLWLKKKFIIETNYCITLDRVPEELFAEVAACDAQSEEWIKLFAIDEIQADLHSPGFSRPLTVEFLKANNKLVLDTRFFDDSFKAQLVASIENFDEQCDGLLIHSENFQALNLLQERYREQVKCVYIDPPYNTGDDGFSYKDGYKSASWITLVDDRIRLGKSFNTRQGLILASIDDKEVANLDWVLSVNYGVDPDVYPFIWHLPRGINAGHIAKAHEYILPYFVDRSKTPKFNKPAHIDQTSIERCNKQIDTRHPESEIHFPAGIEFEGDNAVFESEIQGSERIRIISGKMIFESGKLKEAVTLSAGWTVKNMILSWLEGKQVFDSKGQPIKRFFFKNNGKLYYEKDVNTYSAKSVITGIADTQDATAELLQFFGGGSFTYPKASAVLKYLFELSTERCDTILDYFAGSGTTGHAVINLNREDEGKRKYILVEMGDYFDTVLKPRIAKVVYSESWQDGKPTVRHTGISHCFKYIRLESYEDTLNNLRLDHNPQRKKAVAANPALKEDYMLRYLLDVETRGSQSLLNIDAFADPCRYTLEVKKPGTDEYATRAVDLIETFNYLIGLRVVHYAAPQEFTAQFKRIEDPEVPTDQKTKLVLDGKLQQTKENHRFTQIDTDKEKQNLCSSVSICGSKNGSKSWWFRKVEGWVPKDAANPNNGQREKVLVVWRKLTDDIEQDNLMLDEWFQKNRISTRDFEFDTIYVNGSNNLPNLKLDDENWKVRLIEEEFMKRMWNGVR